MPERSAPCTAHTAPMVSAFAVRALAMLADDLSVRKPDPDQTALRTLKSAIHARDETVLDTALQKLYAADISATQIIDTYIPAAARMLAEDWQTDRVDFAGVTIAAARLQSVLRRLSSEAFVPAFNAPRCLVTLPAGEQHTLGASVLTAQLREQGLDVTLLLHPHTRHLEHHARNDDFAAVMISSYDGNDLAPLSAMVQTLRAGNATVPIVVGGAVLDGRSNLCRAIRADYATNNVQEAIRICGLSSDVKLKINPAFGR